LGKKAARKKDARKQEERKQEAIIMSGRSQGNSSSSGGSGGSYRASFRDRCPEVEYSDDFFGNSQYAATGLYYNISGERRPVPSLEVESDEAWRFRGQFCDIVYQGRVQGGSRMDLVDGTEPPPVTGLLKWTTSTIFLEIPNTLQTASTTTSVAKEDQCQVWRWRVTLTGGSEAIF
jgi:hypothetical protein